MNEFKEAEETKKLQDERDCIITSLDEPGHELPPAQAGLLERVRKLLNSAGERGSGTKQELAKDRTRSLALLIGGTVGAVLLFIGVFSTPRPPPAQQASGRAVPNLGRGTAPGQPTAAQGSVTPLLNADIGPNDSNPDQVSAVDSQATAS